MQGFTAQGAVRVELYGVDPGHETPSPRGRGPRPAVGTHQPQRFGGPGPPDDALGQCHLARLPHPGDDGERQRQDRQAAPVRSGRSARDR